MMMSAWRRCITYRIHPSMGAYSVAANRPPAVQRFPANRFARYDRYSVALTHSALAARTASGLRTIFRRSSPPALAHAASPLA